MSKLTREQLLSLLEWPLREDNMLPRMHSTAQKEWKGCIQPIGNHIMKIEGQLEAYQKAFNRIDDLMEYRGMSKEDFKGIAALLTQQLMKGTKQ